MKRKTRYLTPANICTALRIALCPVLLLLPDTASAAFLIVYTLCGVTDALDGYLARRSGTASTFGARLDSAADLLFYSVMLIKMFPLMLKKLPLSVWKLLAATLLLHAIIYLTAALRYRRFAATHTWLNKATGLMVFLVPYMLPQTFGVGYSAAACIVSLVAGTEELALYLLSPVYRTDVRSILWLCRGKSDCEKTE